MVFIYFHWFFLPSLLLCVFLTIIIINIFINHLYLRCLLNYILLMADDMDLPQPASEIGEKLWLVGDGQAFCCWIQAFDHWIIGWLCCSPFWQLNTNGFDHFFKI
jgi:hypothetical protein